MNLEDLENIENLDSAACEQSRQVNYVKALNAITGVTGFNYSRHLAAEIPADFGGDGRREKVEGPRRVASSLNLSPLNYSPAFLPRLPYPGFPVSSVSHSSAPSSLSAVFLFP